MLITNFINFQFLVSIPPITLKISRIYLLQLTGLVIKENWSLHGYFLHSNFKVKFWTPQENWSEKVLLLLINCKMKGPPPFVTHTPPPSARKGFLGGMVAYSYVNFVEPSIFSQRPCTMRGGLHISEEQHMLPKVHMQQNYKGNIVHYPLPLCWEFTRNIRK